MYIDPYLDVLESNTGLGVLLPGRVELLESLNTQPNKYTMYDEKEPTRTNGIDTAGSCSKAAVPGGGGGERRCRFTCVGEFEHSLVIQ
jgi:hypothetical protein